LVLDVDIAVVKTITRRNLLRVLGALAVLLLAIVLIVRTNGQLRFTPDRLRKLQDVVAAMGPWGPVAYVVFSVLACISLVPYAPLAVAAGMFGAVRGTACASLGTSLGACLAFAIARSVLRPTLERWTRRHADVYQRISRGVARHGWRMVVITRIAPFNPFGMQNYLYGLTDIHFTTYAFFSWLCMLPRMALYVVAGNALFEGKGDIRRTSAIFGAAITGLAMLSLLSHILARKRSRTPIPLPRQETSATIPPH